jgi:hypothetical protein
MECRDVRDMADAFLAQELPGNSSDRMLRHLETCRFCRDDLGARRALRDGVRRAFHHARELAPTPEFLGRMRATLEDAPRQARAPRRLSFPGWWMLAATVLLALASALAYRGVTMAGALARVAVGDHRNCALERRLRETSIPLEEAAQRYGGTTYRILEKLPPDDVTTTAGTARIVRRHACIFEGRQFAHVVFEYRGTLVSLLVTAADDGLRLPLPGEALPHITSARQVDRMSVVSFRTLRHAVFLAGDVAPADLTALAGAIAAPLYRELTGA